MRSLWITKPQEEKRKMKRYKAIFGNPPYSIKTGDKPQNKSLLWDKFSVLSRECAEEVYYVTPLIWNGKAKSFVQHVYDDIGKIDLEINDYFPSRISICYWNTHKPDKLTIHTKSDAIEMDNIRDIKYIPFDFNNTLSIHMKGWRKKSLEIYRNRNRLLFFKENVSSPLIKREQDDEYKYPVFSTNIYNLYYTNEEGLKECKQDLVPKVLIGRSRNNTPFFDRHGEYITTDNAFYILDTMDNLEIRYKQMESKLAKFWFETGREEMGGEQCGFLYTQIFNTFPDIPLSISEDKDIYEWLELTDEEIRTVEFYANEVDELNARRKLRRDKKCGIIKA